MRFSTSVVKKFQAFSHLIRWNFLFVRRVQNERFPFFSQIDFKIKKKIRWEMKIKTQIKFDIIVKCILKTRKISMQLTINEFTTLNKLKVCNFAQIKLHYTQFKIKLWYNIFNNYSYIYKFNNYSYSKYGLLTYSCQLLWFFVTTLSE